MNREERRKFEALRSASGPIENQVIDDLLDGECDRRTFLQRGAMFGLSLSALSAALIAAGETPVALARSAAGTAGGRLRVGIAGKPYGAIEPHTLNSTSGLDIAALVGEYLTRVTGTGVVIPELAVSWKPNATGTRWTVRLRPGVTFHTGQTLSAQDVIATFKRLTDPSQGSAALSSFKGLLQPDGISQGSDQNTVVFELETPMSAFPYFISSTTYQSMILPASYEVGTFTSKSQGTGAFTIQSYTTSASATYNRFDGWWRGRAPLDGVDLTVYDSAAAQDAALLSGAVDLMDYVQLPGDRVVFGRPNQITIHRIAAATGHQVGLRVDRPPWNDYRVRQALALTINRPQMLKTVMLGYGVVGNDHPFATVYPYSVKIPQRVQNIRKAKELLAAAGHPKGLTATLTSTNGPTQTAYAQVLQASARKAGIKLNLKLLDSTVYYASSDSTPWLNAPMTLTGWAARPIVNQYLTATLMSNGAWNAAKYANRKLDSLAKAFFGAIALKDQRKYAKQMEILIQHDTPYIYPYWMDLTAATLPNVKGFKLYPLSFSLGGVSLA